MRILLILLFVSFNGFSKTYDDIMSIKDADSFKKVCIENNYEVVTEERLRDWFGKEKADSMVANMDNTI